MEEKNLEKNLKKIEQDEYARQASLSSTSILHSQLAQALGTHYIVELSYDEEGVEKRTIIKDPARIEELLETGIYGQDYQIIEGTPADWRAGDAILNRAWGKPKESVDVSGDVKFSLVALAEQRKAIDGNKDLSILE